MVKKNVLRSKRGQAALEFLTTYGWAFMVILVMIGALAYFGVLNPQNLIPDQCAITSGFNCKDTLVTNESISMDVVNSMGEAIFVRGFEIIKNGESINASSSGVVNVSGSIFTITDQSCGGKTTLSTCTGASIVDGGEFVLSRNLSTTKAKFVVGQKQKVGFKLTYRKSSGDFNHDATGTITQTVRAP